MCYWSWKGDKGQGSFSGSKGKVKSLTKFRSETQLKFFLDLGP